MQAGSRCALPTPVRNHVARLERALCGHDPCAELAGFRTILSEAPRAGWTAFLSTVWLRLASCFQLISEAPTSMFDVGKVSESVREPPCQIALDCLIPPNPSPDDGQLLPEPQTVGTCHVAWTTACGADLLRFVPWTNLHDVPRPLEGPERFMDWCAAGSLCVQPGPTEELVVTTDGSFKEGSGQAGWGVVLAKRGVGQAEAPGCFVGCLWGSYAKLLVDVGTLCPSPDSFMAELAASVLSSGVYV